MCISLPRNRCGGRPKVYTALSRYLCALKGEGTVKRLSVSTPKSVEPCQKPELFTIVAILCGGIECISSGVM